MSFKDTVGFVLKAWEKLICCLGFAFVAWKELVCCNITIFYL
jgi:hypothetical protein